MLFCQLTSADSVRVADSVLNVTLIALLLPRCTRLLLLMSPAAFTATCWWQHSRELCGISTSFEG